MKYLLTVKRLAVAAVAAAALAGPVTAAHALQFSQGDAVLAVYGNGTEYVANIGTISNVLTNGVDVDLSSFLSTVGAGGNTIKYTVAGYSGTAITFGDNSPIGDWTTLNKNQVVPNTLIGGLQNWSGPLAVAGDARFLFPNVDPLSFSSNLNASGADTLGGTVPSARPGMATIDTVLNLLQRTGGPTTLAQVGTGLLSSQTGHFVVSVNAVPVPAAVVLFATGIIGLVGLARRRMSGKHPDAA